jgi:peptide-methionine (S)-S-oxide reductase
MKNIMLTFSALVWLSLTSCAQDNSSPKKETGTNAEVNYSMLDTATLAGGCFWCVEAAIEQIRGVTAVVSGYAGGQMADPTYRQVSSGATSHTETVQVYFDPAVITYGKVLDIFFTAHDPTQLNRQGPDVGTQYRSAIFYHNEKQKTVAENKITAINASGQYSSKVVTELNPYTTFYMAEEYHQDYERRNPNNPYIRSVSKPKIRRVQKNFSDLLKENEEG